VITARCPVCGLALDPVAGSVHPCCEYPCRPEDTRRRLRALKRAARARVRAAVRRGLIVKSERCEWCGRTGVPLAGHHHAGYVGAAALAVTWLCGWCHRAAHLVEIHNPAPAQPTAANQR
jgi:hypothetical protein